MTQANDKNPPKRHHAPRLNIAPLIEQAEKTGKRVSSITVTLRFGEAGESESAKINDNEVGEWIRKHQHHAN